MEFVPEFAPDAASQWHELEPLLQELVWDKVEELVHNPPAPPAQEIYSDIVHEDKAAWHYVFLSINIDRAKGRITVAGVNCYTRPKSK
jgi:hypothetical protein